MKKIYYFVAIIGLSINFALALEPNLSVNTLPSGQKVVIKEIHDNNIVKIDTWINTGSINEDEKTNGISHFLEHLFFKGTQKYPTGSFDKILDSKGARVNAATSKDYTHYYIQIPSKDFDLALELHADMLLNPMIPRKELERERPVVIEEISKTKDSPTSRMFDNLYKLIYSKSNHPYQRNVIGTKENIQNVTREEILAYYNRFYTPDAFTTVIVGDIDKNYALKKVEEAFKRSEEKKSKQEKIKYPSIKPITKIERIEEKMDINTSYLTLGFLAPKFGDIKDSYVLDVLAAVLSNGKSSILNKNLKEDKDIVLSISSGNYSQKDSGIFYVFATVKPENEKVTEKEILSELTKIKQGQFSDEAVARAKNLIKTDIYYSRESISNISDDLGYDFTFSKNENYYENYIKNIDKVSKTDIINAAKKYLDTEKYAISTISPKNNKITNEKPISDTKETIKAQLIEEKDCVKKYPLNNKANLITKCKKTNSIIAMDISIKGTKMVEEKPITSTLAASTLNKGTQNFTNSQFAQFLDERGIKLGVSSNSDVFTISLQTTKDNLKDALVVLDEILNRPSFQESEIEKVKQRTIQDLKGVSDSPSSFVFDEFKRLAFLNTIYGQNSTFILNNIDKVTREDISKFYSKLINPENMVISIVGDIDEQYLINEFSNIIKPNPKGIKFSYDSAKFVPYKPTTNIQTTLTKNEVQANWLALGYKVCPMRSQKDRKDIATLNVINSILGEGMSSRLFVKLREEQGLAYTVGSGLSLNILDGAYIAYIGTNEQNIEKAKEGILKELNTIKTEMVTTRELDDAKNKIMGKFLMSLETNMSEANLFSWYEILGRDLGAYEEYKKMIMDVTQSDIIEVANRYFSKPYIYTVVRKKK